MFPLSLFQFQRPVWSEDRGSKKNSPLEPKVESMFDLIESKLHRAQFQSVMGEPGTYYGFAAGACTGFALKKIAKAAALTFGAVFIGFQVAAKSQYVTVNWSKIEADAKKYLPEKPGDDSQMVSEAIDFLTTNTGIATAVFTAGFVTGLKLG